MPEFSRVATTAESLKQELTNLAYCSIKIQRIIDHLLNFPRIKHTQTYTASPIFDRTYALLISSKNTEESTISPEQITKHDVPRDEQF